MIGEKLISISSLIVEWQGETIDEKAMIHGKGANIFRREFSAEVSFKKLRIVEQLKDVAHMSHIAGVVQLLNGKADLFCGFPCLAMDCRTALTTLADRIEPSAAKRAQRVDRARIVNLEKSATCELGFLLYFSVLLQPLVEVLLSGRT